jgi:two-component system chemotaxis response regulator CheY
VCLEAANGSEALEVLRKEWVDLILTDINMPVMNGEELMRRLERDEALRSIPVLVVSTDGTSQRIQQMMTLGARRYLAKPFTPEGLREELERLLEAPRG